MAMFLKALAGLGPIGRRLWTAQARRDLRGISMNSEQQRALGVYTHTRFLAETARWARHLAHDGTALASDLAAGKLHPIPAIIVSASNHRPRSAVRRAHQQLATWIPGATLQVWDNTTHPLHIQQPDRVTNAVLALLEHIPCRDREAHHMPAGAVFPELSGRSRAPLAQPPARASVINDPQPSMTTPPSWAQTQPQARSGQPASKCQRR